MNNLDPTKLFAMSETRSVRRNRSKQARLSVPLKEHSIWRPGDAKRNTVRMIQRSNEGRIPELIPVRHGRMLPTPFTYYRGSAVVMAADLSKTPTSGFVVQACGDCHIQNFGAFATPERNVILDLNDFDETLPAPWEWDVKRLAASLVLAAQANGLSDDFGGDCAYRTARQYREYMLELSELPRLARWYSRLDFNEFAESLDDSVVRDTLKRSLKEAKSKSSSEYLLGKLTEDSFGVKKFCDKPPTLFHLPKATDEETLRDFNDYVSTLPDDRRVFLSPYAVVDVAIKAVGIGSVGTRCGVVLLSTSDNDLLVLQLKEAKASVLEAYAGKSLYSHHGQRVVNGQRLMQASSDMFLGWYTSCRSNSDYYVRQLRDVKVPVDTSSWNKQAFKELAPVTGKILARAHSRSGDVVTISAYLGKSDEFEIAISKFATLYAKQIEQDYEKFVKACKRAELLYQERL